MKSFALGKFTAALILVLALAACGSPAAEVEPTQAEAGGEPAAPATEESPAAEAPAEPGVDFNNPAPMSATVTTAGWEFTVLEVVRGEEALAMVEAASAFNGPPDDHTLEWAVVRVRAKYVGDSPTPMRVAKTFFQSAGSEGAILDRPRITDVDNVEPELDATLSTGEEAEGWVTLFSPLQDPRLVLIIDPRIYNGDTAVTTVEQDSRYILLSP
jgi:hypothetical protein